MKTREHVYWRIKGEVVWRYGWPTDLGAGLYMMGSWCGDTTQGQIVNGFDVETKPYIESHH